MTRRFSRIVVVDAIATDAAHCSLTCPFWNPPGVCRGTHLRAEVDGWPTKKRVFLRTLECIRDEALIRPGPTTIVEALQMVAEAVAHEPRIDEVRPR